jgi:hypothetical protein
VVLKPDKDDGLLEEAMSSAAASCGQKQRTRAAFEQATSGRSASLLLHKTANVNDH